MEISHRSKTWKCGVVGKCIITFATSEPACPIAIPTSARFSEGESLTPSPVYKIHVSILTRHCKNEITHHGTKSSSAV